MPILSRIFRAIKFIIPLLIADIVFFSLINPTNSNSFVIILACLLSALTFYELFLGLMKLISFFLTISVKSQRRFALFITVLTMFLLLMQSIGQLSLRDILAIVPLMIILYLYITYSSRLKARSS